MFVGRTRGRIVKRVVARVAGRSTGRTALGGGRARTRLNRRALLPPKEPAGARYTRYGLVVLGGFAVGVLLGSRGKRGDAPPSPTRTTQASDVPTSDPGGPEGWPDEKLGSANPTEDSGGDGGEASAQAEPKAGDLKADSPEAEGADPPAPPSEPPPQEDSPGRAGVTAQPEGIEGRIRARIEEDPRTSDLQPLGIDVDDGMATIEGSAPSAEAKEALTEVVRDVEGVNIVVNKVRVISP